MKREVRQMMTGRDNFTVDLFRVSVAASVVVALALVSVSVLWPGHPFDIQAFGIGMGSLLGAAGLALKLKQDTEPGESGTVATSTTTSTVTEKTA